MKVYRKHGGEAPHIADFRASWSWVVNFMLWLFHTWRKSGTIRQETVWTPKLV